MRLFESFNNLQVHVHDVVLWLTKFWDLLIALNWIFLWAEPVLTSLRHIGRVDRLQEPTPVNQKKRKEKSTEFRIKMIVFVILKTVFFLHMCFIVLSTSQSLEIVETISKKYLVCKNYFGHINPISTKQPPPPNFTMYFIQIRERSCFKTTP